MKRDLLLIAGMFAAFLYLADRYHHPIDAASGSAFLSSSLTAIPVIVTSGVEEATTIANSGARDAPQKNGAAVVHGNRTVAVIPPSPAKPRPPNPEVAFPCSGGGLPDANGNLNYCLDGRP